MSVELTTTERNKMISHLSARYSSSVRLEARMRQFYKKTTWNVVVGLSQGFKRVLDVTFSAAMLVLLAPVFILVAAAIKCSDGGPVIFWQKRIGKFGKAFQFPKFRSMVVNAEALKDQLLDLSHHAEGVTFKMKRDPRVTWVGRIIRKLSIDELPQFWCVVKGDMSLVGPRPPVEKEVAKYSTSDRRRLEVKPGLTCTWQVSGRGDIPFSQQVKLDVQYIESHTFWMDVVILVKTVPAVLLGRGAY